MVAPAILVGKILSPLPLVPSTVPLYKSTQSTTTDETATTFLGVDIGTPHPKRLVILAVYQGVAANPTGTVNGIDWSWRSVQGAFSLFAFPVPTGATADIVISVASSLRKAVSIYVAYPNNHQPIDFQSASATGTSNAISADVKVQAGGFLIYSAGQNISASTFTTTWSGADAVVEDADAILEVTSAYSAGHINITASSDLDDLTLASTLSGTKILIAASWGPPAPGN